MASSGSSSRARMSVRFPEARDKKGTESSLGSSPSVLDLPTEMLQRVFQNSEDGQEKHIGTYYR